MISASSPFLYTLPPEIRLQIYSYLLVASTPVKGTIARSFQSETYNIHTSILRTNKQIYTEAKHIFFGLNTFHITSASSLAEDDCSSPSGSFEPPLQLRDLSLIRHLKIDLLYFPRQVHMDMGSDGQGEEWMPVCTNADQYATSLVVLLSSVKDTLSSLEIVADCRPYTSYDESSSINTEELDVKSYLTGFCAADRNWQFRDALAGMKVARFGMTFDFPESVFELNADRDHLVDKRLIVLAGQILVARSEIRMRTTIDQMECCHEGLEIVVEQKKEDVERGEIIVPWPFVGIGQ